jgi:hypothetical protein
MPLPSAAVPRPSRHAGPALPWWLGLALAAGGCGAQAPAPAPAPAAPAAAPAGPAASPADAAQNTQRLIVFLRQDWPETDPEGLARRLTALADLPVTVVRPMNPRQWVVVMACGSGSCEAATQRLARDNLLLQGLEIDQRMRIPPQPRGPVLR